MKKYEKGSGEFVGYAVSMIGLVSLILLLIGFFMLSRAANQMENVIDIVSRDIVVCESIDEARVLAQEEAEEYLQNYMSTIREGSVSVEVEFSPGAEQEWEKGSFVTVLVSAYVDCKVPFISGQKTVSAMVMIERTGD